MPSGFFDTHCHLDIEPLASSVEAVLQRANAANVPRCVSIGTSVEASQANVALARRFPGVFAAVGVHPNDADSVTDQTFSDIQALAADPRVVAIGEIGLDYYRQDASPANQHRALIGFIEIAQRRDKPVLIHCRDAYEDLIKTLKARATSALRGIIHCASGPPQFIQEALGLGFYISFAGNVTYPNAHALRQLVPLVPDDRLLIETDAPFLAPQPVRGQKNEPAFVAHTAGFLAKQRGMSVEELASSTTRNAQNLFGLRDEGARPL